MAIELACRAVVFFIMMQVKTGGVGLGKIDAMPEGEPGGPDSEVVL